MRPGARQARRVTKLCLFLLIIVSRRESMSENTYETGENPQYFVRHCGRRILAGPDRRQDLLLSLLQLFAN